MQPKVRELPVDLERFLSAQEDIYPTALAELRQGQKRGHWIWFIFPQLAGLGSSPTSKYFGIRGFAEARAYLRHPVLGPRLVECCRALLAVSGRSAAEILGHPDDLKLRSSMTLFSRVEGAPAEIREVLFHYYEGRADLRTLTLLTTGDAPQ
jgi:uncharacterized protein (DUF1810 family)